MKKLLLIAILSIYTLNLPAQTWELVWSDEFDYTGLPNPQKWSYDVGGNGWGNNELQYYTQNRSENARVANGILTIEARKESFEGKNYTSARLVTKSKGDWTYGKIEVRAKLPAGKGSWPAIWMLPTTWSDGNGGWPDNGEIDIMEHVGYDQGWINGTVHCNKYNWPAGTQKGAKTFIQDCSTTFHNYILEWSADKITIWVDETKYFTFYNDKTGWQSWPFYKPFHLLLNIAVGGNWGGAQGVDDAIFPIKMEVDYVRVYRSITTGIDNKDQGFNNLKIFPNPVNNQLNITLPEEIKNSSELKIFSPEGKQMYYTTIQQANNQLTINDLQLAPGMYFIQLSSNNQLFTEKFIKL